MAINPHSVLLVAEDAFFPRELMDCWRLERPEPEFTVLNAELMESASGDFHVAVVGPLPHHRLAQVLKTLRSETQNAGTRDAEARPVICVVESPARAQAMKAEFPRLPAVARHEGWPETVFLLASECLKRVDLAARVRQAEQAAATHARQAALGALLLENRHDFNNLLTSLLGNAELLLEGGPLPETARDQVETIHAMALQMYEMMQRFPLSPPPAELARAMKV